METDIIPQLKPPQSMFSLAGLRPAAPPLTLFRQIRYNSRVAANRKEMHMEKRYLLAPGPTAHTAGVLLKMAEP